MISEQTDEFREEMDRWASRFGSDRLRMGLQDGYRMVGVYLGERSAREGFETFFAFQPDAFNRWQPRSGPTEEALLLRREFQAQLDGLGLEAEIVWLKKAPDGMLEPHEGEWTSEDECEAIVIPGWLGRYVLITTVHSDEVPVPEIVLCQYVAGAE